MADVPGRKFKLEHCDEANPVVTHAVETFQHLDPKFGNHEQARSLDFWLTALEVQLAEIRAARDIGDWQKVAWELTDIITVAIDAIAKTEQFGIWKLSNAHVKAHLISGTIEERLAINRKKAQEMSSRDQKYYEDKLRELTANGKQE